VSKADAAVVGVFHIYAYQLTELVQKIRSITSALSKPAQAVHFYSWHVQNAYSHFSNIKLKSDCATCCNR
jgi:hypothetical protein